MPSLQLAGRMRDALRSWVPAGLHIGQPNVEEFPPLTRNGLTARCRCDWPNEPDFLDQWNALLERNPWATVFRAPAWQCAAADQFVPAGELRLITVERDNQLLAVVPLAFNATGLLETPGRWVTDYLDPLVDETNSAQCWTIILEFLDGLWDWSVGGVYLPHIRGDSGLRTLLPQLVSRFDFTYEEEVFDYAPYIPLPGTWEEYLQSLDAHERKELKRKLRNAETKGKLQWTTHHEPEEFEEALDRALAMMRQCSGNKGDFTDEILVGFLRRICPTLQKRGEFVLHELWLENKPAAYLLALNSHRGPMIYNTAYDFAARNWSPGVVAFALAIRDAIAAGNPVFNLLRGGEDYKKRLGAVDLELLKIYLRRV